MAPEALHTQPAWRGGRGVGAQESGGKPSQVARPFFIAPKRYKCATQAPRRARPSRPSLATQDMTEKFGEAPGKKQTTRPTDGALPNGRHNASAARKGGDHLETCREWPCCETQATLLAARTPAQTPNACGQEPRDKLMHAATSHQTKAWRWGAPSHRPEQATHNLDGLSHEWETTHSNAT